MTASIIPQALTRKLESLPDGPGVYIWKDAAGAVLYVGKAANLRSRVRSYFTSDHSASPKNQLLVRLIADVETIVVEHEAQSLLLENNLIKEYQPRFNRSEEHTPELQSHSFISYAVFCLKKKHQRHRHTLRWTPSSGAAPALPRPAL